jgi:hypothetical protein
MLIIKKLILSVFCYFPSRPLTKATITTTNLYYRNFYGEQPKIEELIVQEAKRTPGRTIITGMNLSKTLTKNRANSI